MPPGSNLQVAETPIFSRTSGSAENLIKNADIVFATSSLEVGYDDPNIALVYQHYAPQNLASFVQRKGRGGRRVDDRPITAVTLSIYSPRDSWWFRRPHEMVSPKGFDVPLNPDNYFVRRGQVVSAMLDAFARMEHKGGKALDEHGRPTVEAAKDAAEYIERVLGSQVWEELGFADFEALWKHLSTKAASARDLTTLRHRLPWAPRLLFDTVNLPSFVVDAEGVSGELTEDISFGLSTVAPGNATRRFDGRAVHWRPPVHGRAPWFAPSDYQSARWEDRFFENGEELLNALPSEVHGTLTNLVPKICRPSKVRLERLGRVFGAGWTSEWVCDGSKPVVTRSGPASAGAEIKHESRSTLRGFVFVKDNSARGKPIDHKAIDRWVSGIESFTTTAARGVGSGLHLAQVYWGADAEIRIDTRKAESISFAQTFVEPTTGRPLLHGYSVETEGIRFKLNSSHLDKFISGELGRLASDEKAKRWHAAQFMRYLVESRAQNLGINAHEARCGADLVVAAAGSATLRTQLQRLLNFWDPTSLRELFESTRNKLLSQHPLMTPKRVLRAATALGTDAFRDLLKRAIAEVKNEQALAGYLRSVVLHSLAIRLRQSFIHVGKGDERRVVAHVKLPIQFAGVTDDVITICEVGAHGDGTTRGVLADASSMFEHWTDGFIADCPSASEDGIVQRFWGMQEKHDGWRSQNPGDVRTIHSLARDLNTEGEQTIPQSLLRLLYSTEAVGSEWFDLYKMGIEIETARVELEAQLGRASQDWELMDCLQ